jgi:hypothetical protein
VAKQGVECGLAAILSADTVGHGRLMGEDGAGTRAALKAHRNVFLGRICDQPGWVARREARSS